MKRLTAIISTLVLLIACGTAPATTGPQGTTPEVSAPTSTATAPVSAASSQSTQLPNPNGTGPSAVRPTNTPNQPTATTVVLSSTPGAADPEESPGKSPNLERFDLSTMQGAPQTLLSDLGHLLASHIELGETHNNTHLLVPEGAIPPQETVIYSATGFIKSIQLLDNTSTIITIQSGRIEYDIRFDVPLIIRDRNEYSPASTMGSLAIDAKAREHVDQGVGDNIKQITRFGGTIGVFDPENSPWPVIVGGTDPYEQQAKADTPAPAPEAGGHVPRATVNLPGFLLNTLQLREYSDDQAKGNPHLQKVSTSPGEVTLLRQEGGGRITAVKLGNDSTLITFTQSGKEYDILFDENPVIARMYDTNLTYVLINEAAKELQALGHLNPRWLYVESLSPTNNPGGWEIIGP